MAVLRIAIRVEAITVNAFKAFSFGIRLLYYLPEMFAVSAYRKMGLWASTSLIIGSIIGAGVFMKPASMAAQLGSPLLLTAVWIIAGLFSLFGALVYAELGAMMPETGGLYVYFRKIFGDFIAYLYGWSGLAVMNTAAIAAIAFVCAYYADFFLHLPHFPEDTIKTFSWHIPFLGDLYPLQDAGVKSLAILLIILFTFLNSQSLRAGSYFQVVSTIVKVLVLAALVFGILFSGQGTVRHFYETSQNREGVGLLGGVIAALTGAFFAFDGWVNITSMAGEVKQPQRNIPRSLWIGLLTCIIVYVLVNQAYLYVIPIDRMAESKLVASDAIAVVFGQAGEALIAALIVICTLGAVNGNIMATTRITYAMGKDGLFARCTGREHPRHHTPSRALWLHGAWTCVFVITGTFDMLADMFVFVAWMAYGLGAVGIFLLRYRMPEAERPYRIWGHPFITILFIGFSAFFLVFTVWSDIQNYLAQRQPVINSLLGLSIMSLGIPFYYYFRSKNKGKSK